MKNLINKILIAFIFLLSPKIIFASTDTFPAFLMNGFIKENGSILVGEEFIFDFGDNPRHGIIRTIPLVLSGSNRWYEIGNIEAKDKDKNPIGVESTHTGNIAKIKIGDPNITLTGTHYYNLRYSMTNVAGNSELTWQLVSPMRESIDKFEANIYFPVLVPIESSTSSCEIIPERHDGSSCTITIINKANKIAGYKFDIKNILKEDVTIKIKYPMGVVVNNFVEEKSGLKFDFKLNVIVTAVILILILSLIFKYRKYLAEKITELKIHAENPEIYSYIERGYYYNNSVTKEDLVYEIADLMDRGYLNLTAVATPIGDSEFVDYSIEVVSTEIDNETEKYLLEALSKNTQTLSEWISSNFDNISMSLTEISKKTMDSKKLYKDNSPRPTLEGFKII